MRIISGNARGIRLTAPPGEAVRPTTDRVKESVFASLGPVAGYAVADLFSGSGALGLEALSRGAAQVILVERDRRALAALRANAAAVLHAMGAAAGALVVAPVDVSRVPQRLAEWAGKLQLILADPPYEPAAGSYGAPALLRDPAFADWAGDALLVLEHAVGTPLPWFPEGHWRLERQKPFGSLVVSFARRQCRG